VTTFDKMVHDYTNDYQGVDVAGALEEVQERCGHELNDDLSTVQIFTMLGDWHDASEALENHHRIANFAAGVDDEEHGGTDWING
jgi:hypothetical protein